VVLDNVKLVSGVEPPPPPPPEAVPPVYDKLKDLYLTTDLVKDGQPNVTIVAPASGVYAEDAQSIQQAIQKLTGVSVPIATDESPAAAVPIKGNLIALGNRSTNKTIGRLYDLYYTLLDLRYPGPEGYVVRTLHNPFGDGRNVVFVGGSDAAGVKAGAAKLVELLKRAGSKQGALSIGWTAEIKLGKGIEVPKELTDFKIWEASAGYRSSGYFGWNSISKRMAMYYMTGDEFQAREALRLAFPDDKAKAEITKIDGERIENKDDPLAGPYHYNAHMMILFWDLIEESPVFTDAERLKVTNAFSRQLNHRKGEGVYGLTTTPRAVGSRHGQWAAISLYCLGRYFQKDYPNPIWAQCVRGAKLAFSSLHRHAWVGGESDNLFWYNTGIAPILTYMVLTGDRKPLENGVLQTLLRGQEMLISGRVPDWALNSASIGFLHKTAYVTQDGRWLTYRDRTGVDLDAFRLGQSFWPEEHLQPTRPDDLVGKWSINRLPKPMWQARNSGLPLDESFLFGSYRSAADASGDFVLLDGFNGASRNPYHTFAILELRLAGRTLLQGYLNQVLTRADGLVEPQVAMNAALRYCDVVGGTATAVGEVPKAAYCNWRRTLAQRTGRYALVVDDLAFRTDSQNIEVQTLWDTVGGSWSAKTQTLRIRGAGGPALPPGWRSVRALEATCRSEPSGAEYLVPLRSIGIMLLRATSPGQWLEMEFSLPKAVTGDLFADFVNYLDRGSVRLFLDGKRVGEDYDHYAPNAVPGRAELGHHELAAGKHRLRAEVVAQRPGQEKCYIGLAGLSIRPEGAPASGGPPAFELRTCDPVKVTMHGRTATMEWLGPVKQGQHLRFFSLIGQGPAGNDTRLACLRVADNAAALALPAPAVAVVGEYEGLKGDLVVLAEDHLYGQALTRAGIEGALVSADAPVDLDWNFATGTLHVVAATATQVELALAATEALQLDGKAIQGQRGADGLTAFELAEGRHVFEGAKPEQAAQENVGTRLAALLARAQEKRTAAVAAAAKRPKPSAPALKTAMQTNVGGDVVDLATIPSAEGSLVCAAEGKTVHVLSADGKEVRTLQADGKIRLVHWWPEHKLLLVGCADEQVIAFDEQGRRKWVFTSVMDPAVFRAAKDYWFKTAPGHEGIHGLATGVFLNGKSQAFVGSACTLEILDENGKLIKRMPQFWGTVSLFALVPGPNGSVNLLAARKYNGTNTVRIINNKKLDPGERGFYSVPPGHTYVGGWSSMNRYHLFCEDLDGDGTKEVISEINGTWNRVTVWTLEGKPLYDASFGPGARISGPGARFPTKNMRDLEIADLDGDGKKEILAATSSGLIVALNYKCEKLWATRLDRPPTVMKCMTPQGAKLPWIIVGCEDGSVVVLDGKGQVIRLGKVTGRPTCIEGLPGPEVLLATQKGEVKAFEVGG